MSLRRSSLQFNIRPWRFLAGQSVATAGAASSIGQSVYAGGACGARTKKTGVRPNGLGSGRGGMTASMSARFSRLRPLGHDSDGPAPARQLARRRHVGLVLLDAAVQHRGAPVDEPAHALGGVAPRGRVRRLAFGQVLRMRRASQVVPRRLDEHSPQMLVARLGDAALPHALAAGVLRRRQSQPRRERPGVLEPGELASKTTSAALATSMPFRHLTESTLRFHLGLEASASTSLSRRALSSMACLVASM